MNTNLRLGLMLGFVLGALVACGDDDEKDLPDVDCSGTIPAYEDVAAFDKCTSCHSSMLEGEARNKAPTNVNFDTESAARAHAEEAAHEVYAGDMPPSGSGITLTSAEKDDLYKWALCE